MSRLVSKSGGTMEAEAATRALRLLAGEKRALELATEGASVETVLTAIAEAAVGRFGPYTRAACFVLDEASSSLRFSKVGVIMCPPLRRAATTAAPCSGCTAKPWPKAAVAVESLLQCRGSSGLALSGSSVCSRSNSPTRRRNA